MSIKILLSPRRYERLLTQTPRLSAERCSPSLRLRHLRAAGCPAWRRWSIRSRLIATQLVQDAVPTAAQWRWRRWCARRRALGRSLTVGGQHDALTTVARQQ